MSRLTKKLMFSWKKLKKGSGGAVSEGLEPGCRLRNDVERRGNRVSKNNHPLQKAGMKRRWKLAKENDMTGDISGMGGKQTKKQMV